MGGKGRRSKKRSVASSKSKQLEPLVFFLDRSLGKEIIANALRAAGADVRIHDDLFAQDARDLDWLPEVGKLGWTVLTKDSHIKHRLVERRALLESGVRAFVLVSGNLTDPEMAKIFVQGPAGDEQVRRKTPTSFHRQDPSGQLHRSVGARIELCKLGSGARDKRNSRKKT